MRLLSANEGDVEDDAAAAKKFVILCVNTEIFVQVSFNSLFQLLIVSSRSKVNQVASSKLATSEP